MHKLHAILKKAGISLLTAFTVFTNTNMGTLVALAAEHHLDEGEELYQITDGDNTYSIKEYTTDDSEVLFALRPTTTYSTDDQYESYADDGIESYLSDNDVSKEQIESVRKIISVGYGTEPNAGNYVASQVLIWQIMTGDTYEVDENVAANMEDIQTRISRYATDTDLDGYEITFTGYGEDHAVTLENEGFVDYKEKEIPEGYHVETDNGILKVWTDEGTKEGTLSFEQYDTDLKNILYAGSGGDYLSLKQSPNVIHIHTKFDIPVEEPQSEEPEETKAEAKLEKGLKAAKAAKAPVNNESVVAESVGDVRLIDISDVHVDYLKTDGETMTEGETFQTTNSSLSFIGRLKWKIPNSVDLTNIERVTYQLPKNVKLTEWSGDVTYRGEVVGTFEIDDSSMLFISYTDDFKKESNRAGWFKFETESMKNKSKEQNLLFESGEEYSFKLKDPDPPTPVTPKIGIEKEYNKISDLAISSNGETPYDIHFTVKVYSEKGVNNNVIVSDSYKWSKVPLDTQNGLYKVKIENKEGEVVFQQLFQNSLSWSSGNYVPFSWNSNGYEGEIGGLTPPYNPASFPTVKLNHLNDGDVLTIDYYMNDLSDNKYFFAGNKSVVTNTATVVSDENPDSESDESYDFAKSNKRYLKQKDSVDVSRNPDGFVDKQVTVKDDTVHTEITINKNEEYTYFHRSLPLNLMDIPTNFSVEPSDDADYYLDKDSFKIELSALVYDGRKGNSSYAGNNYKREVVLTKTAEDLESLFNDSANADYLQSFFHGMMLSGGILTSSDYESLLSPIVTISYDFKVNQDKFIACEKIEYSGSNTLTFDGAITL